MTDSYFRARIDAAKGDSLWDALKIYADYIEERGERAIADGLRWLAKYKRLARDDYNEHFPWHFSLNDLAHLTGIDELSNELPRRLFHAAPIFQSLISETKSGVYLNAARSFAEQKALNHELTA